MDYKILDRYYFQIKKEIIKLVNIININIMSDYIILTKCEISSIYNLQI